MPSDLGERERETPLFSSTSSFSPNPYLHRTGSLLLLLLSNGSLQDPSGERKPSVSAQLGWSLGDLTTVP